MARYFTALSGGLLLLLALSFGASVRPGLAATTTADTHDSWWRTYRTSALRVRLPDGRHLTLFCEGRGSPVVVLEGGLGGGAWGWSTVQDDIARRTRVCSYDRAGYSDSDPATSPRTFDALASDLNAVLAAAHVPGPYVMVGQSLGGPIVGVFAQQHPARVAGLVFVDPSSGGQNRRMAAIAPDTDDWTARIAAARKCVDAADRGTLLPGSAIETSCVRARPGLNPPAFVAQTFAKWEHGSDLRAKLAETEGVDFETLRWPQGARAAVPVIVLTAADSFAGAPKEQDRWALWKTMHDEIARLSPHGVNCIIPRSTHSMMLSRPDAVVNAVSAMVGAAHDNRSATFDCDALAGGHP